MGFLKDLKEGIKYAAGGRATKPEAKPKPKEEQVGTKQGKEAMSAIEQRKKAMQQAAEPNSYKKGGMVKKTGMAKVHKGERVLNQKQTKKLAAKPAVAIMIGVAPKPAKAAPKSRKK